MEDGVELYMEQPQGFIDPEFPDYVCLLKKSLYGIKQAPRLWQDDLSSYLIENLGFKPTSDPCILRKDNIFIALYVDDIIIAAPSVELSDQIFQLIRQRYKCKDLGQLKSYIGFEILYRNNEILLTQRRYIELILNNFNMNDCIPSNTPFKTTLSNVNNWNKPTNAPFRQAIGALLFLSTGTRPDISFIVGALARHVENPTDEAWECLKHVLRYLKLTQNFALSFTKPTSPQTNEIVAYSDSDWAGDKTTRRSTSGSVVFHNGNLVDWASKLQKCITLSSCEAELIALSQTTQDTIWIKRLLLDMTTDKTSQITESDFYKTPVVFADNQSALKVARDPRNSGRMKHVDLRDLFVREKVLDRSIMVQYAKSAENIADILTKPLYPQQQFSHLRRLLNLKEIPRALLKD
jgi:hypothetical protein